MRKKKKDDHDPFFKTLNILCPFRYSKARHIRIADILVDEELGSETGGYDCPETSIWIETHTASPRTTDSRPYTRQTEAMRRRMGQKRPKEVAKTERETGDDESTHVTGSTNGLNGGGGETESRQIVKDTSSFNLGVACGLVYLIVTGKNELAKTAELRAEMEQLLQNAKEEAEQEFAFRFQGVGTIAAAFGMDSENHSSNSNYTQQQRLNLMERDDISDFEKKSSAHGAEPADYNEIPVTTEFLHSNWREERIKELEVALEYTKRKLHEKEMEASWWRQNASAALTSTTIKILHRRVLPSTVRRVHFTCLGEKTKLYRALDKLLNVSHFYFLCNFTGYIIYL
ncbi:protein POLAR [Pyrus ussuriensis x Pyrus communis]|uniref:Protein POLAR n=1 Tax=Pyrus ussuriensis x Pyrus communis TaxID=2448454 RepID=A0A5N5HM85_9ROSA|nr:protein POLAR [Pyrus ussuriensis x Pyrus communis]